MLCRRRVATTMTMTLALAVAIAVAVAAGVQLTGWRVQTARGASVCIGGIPCSPRVDFRRCCIMTAAAAMAIASTTTTAASTTTRRTAGRRRPQSWETHKVRAGKEKWKPETELEVSINRNKINKCRRIQGNSITLTPRTVLSDGAGQTAHRRRTGSKGCDRRRRRSTWRAARSG